MKEKVKITVFLLIIAIVLNINIGLDNKHFVQVGIDEVEAEAPWEDLAPQIEESSYIPGGTIKEHYIDKYNFSSEINNNIVYGWADVEYYMGWMTNTSLSYTYNGSAQYNYRIRCASVRSSFIKGAGGSNIGVRVTATFVVSRQLINSIPALTITAPTPNSPLYIT